jgi:hypothetical protein
MTNYGDTSAMVFIATAQTGTAGSETPSGDIFYLIAAKWALNKKNLIKKSNIAGGTTMAPSLGKRDWSLKLSDVYPMPYGSITTQDAAFNDMMLYFNLKTKSAAAAFYIFVKSVQGNYIKLGYNVTVNTTYMKVKLGNYPSEPEGEIYKFTELTFEEVTAG